MSKNVNNDFRKDSPIIKTNKQNASKQTEKQTQIADEVIFNKKKHQKVSNEKKKNTKQNKERKETTKNRRFVCMTALQHSLF